MKPEKISNKKNHEGSSSSANHVDHQNQDFDMSQYGPQIDESIESTDVNLSEFEDENLQDEDQTDLKKDYKKGEQELNSRSVRI